MSRRPFSCQGMQAFPFFVYFFLGHLFPPFFMQRDEGQRAAQPPPPGGWPAGSPSPSSPQGLETRSSKRARTDSAPSSSADSNGTLGTVVDAQRALRRVTADSYQGHTTSTYRTWLHGIDPRTAGAPAYTSYIGAKVAQQFDDDDPFIVLTETKFSFRCIPVWIGTLLTGLGSKKKHM